MAPSPPHRACGERVANEESTLLGAHRNASPLHPASLQKSFEFRLAFMTFYPSIFVPVSLPQPARRPLIGMVLGKVLSIFFFLRYQAVKNAVILCIVCCRVRATVLENEIFSQLKEQEMTNTALPMETKNRSALVTVPHVAYIFRSTLIRCIKRTQKS